MGLAQRYPRLRTLGVEVVAFGPDRADAFRAYFERAQLPFRGVPDPSGQLLAELGQEVNWLRLGRMPALLAVRKDGEVAYVHRGRSMRDLPDIEAALAALGVAHGDAKGAAPSGAGAPS